MTDEPIEDESPEPVSTDESVATPAEPTDEAPERVTVTYQGPSGSLIDGNVTFNRGEPVETTREHLDRLRRHVGAPHVWTEV